MDQCLPPDQGSDKVRVEEEDPKDSATSPSKTMLKVGLPPPSGSRQVFHPTLPLPPPPHRLSLHGGGGPGKEPQEMQRPKTAHNFLWKIKGWVFSSKARPGKGEKLCAELCL